MANWLPKQWKDQLDNLQERIEHFLERWKPRAASGGVEALTSDRLPSFLYTGGPPLEMVETPDGLRVTAEIPGLDKDDCSIELSGRYLTIRAEKNLCRDTRREGVSYSECRYGSFRRTIELPCEVDDGQVSAHLQHGVLTVRLPRAPSPSTATRYKVPIS